MYENSMQHTIMRRLTLTTASSALLPLCSCNSLEGLWPDALTVETLHHVASLRGLETLKLERSVLPVPSLLGATPEGHSVNMPNRSLGALDLVGKAGAERYAVGHREDKRVRSRESREHARDKRESGVN